MRRDCCHVVMWNGARGRGAAHEVDLRTKNAPGLVTLGGPCRIQYGSVVVEHQTWTHPHWTECVRTRACDE